MIFVDKFCIAFLTTATSFLLRGTYEENAPARNLGFTHSRVSDATARTCRAAAVVGDDAVDESLLDLGLDRDQVGAVIFAAADRRLGQLFPLPIDDVARPDAVEAGREVVRTEPRLHRCCIIHRRLTFAVGRISWHLLPNVTSAVFM